jgi:hypothetical protein
MNLNPFQTHKSLEELEEENERQELELSIAQKKALIARLKARGGNPNDFKKGKGKGFSFSAITNWLKTH